LHKEIGVDGHALFERVHSETSSVGPRHNTRSHELVNKSANDRH
jgi:hypothetical protein